MFRKQLHSETIDRQNQDNGFTLIEVLIAISIFAIGFLAVARLQIRAIQQNTGSRLHMEATALASGHLEFLTALPYDDPLLAAGEYTRTQDGFTISWKVTDDTPITDTKSIRITVNSENPNAQPIFIDYIKRSQIEE